MSTSKDVASVVAQGARDDLLNFGILVEDKFDINWHHRLIADRLRRVYDGLGTKKGLKRLMIAMPPQIANKSTLASKLFPAWGLGKNPNLNFIVGSYNATMAKSHSKKSLNLARETIYEDIFGTKLNPRKRSAEYWGVVGGRDGGYRAFGMKTGITGNPADCFVAGTKIMTEFGEKNIEDCKDWESVLSYNHDNDKLEYKRILATKRSVRKRLAKVTLSDCSSFTATRDHRILISGKGYIKIKDIKTEGEEKCWVLKREKGSGIEVSPLREPLQDRVGRIYKKSKKRLYKNVLFKKMFGQSCENKLREEMREVWKPNWQKDIEILFPKVQTKPKTFRKYLLSKLQCPIQTIKSFDKVLFNGLQKRLSLRKNEREEKPELETRNGNEYLSEGVLQSKTLDSPEGQSLYYLRQRQKTACSSSRFKSDEQSFEESSFVVQHLPYHSSQVKGVTISSIDFIEDEQYVYDIQVADNENFFANGVLVHNCAIIDDPIKGREDANSKLMRDKVYDIYTEEVMTRLLPDIGALILIFTRWHLDDPVGRIERELMEKGKKLEDEWEVLHLPAIAEEDEEWELLTGEKVGRKKGESIWHDRFPTDPVLLRLKDNMPASTWASLYQQNPISKETQVFKPEMFQQIEEAEVNTKDTVRLLAIDTSSGTGDDFTGFADVRIDRKSGFWYVHAWHEKLKPLELIDKLFHLRQVNRYTRIGMEATMFQKVFEPFLREEMLKRNEPFYMEELRNRNLSKDLRVYGLEPMYSSGKVFHISGKCGILEEELEMYGSAANDDVADALAYIPEMIKDFNTQQYSELDATVPDVPSYE